MRDDDRSNMTEEELSPRIAVSQKLQSAIMAYINACIEAQRVLGHQDALELHESLYLRKRCEDPKGIPRIAKPYLPVKRNGKRSRYQ